ncbi:hypothetical protein DDB_G0270454 [Dictyostelium discoideum AX4]|uniref:Putative phosphatidylglycerol/phosphatidylinositol transfer protein 1 n=1 Tax=Dictyostelium discoideum TaxID=44689 RepID=NPC21_DICDI|nr:hypothetical protein DDB_G0270454 [Dictyostelium discoideum AX4]Q55BL4.1 RecName: Full=Putative phosphatidylglycerol/phosphatidylinositol transfer protein 1; Short=PG/PI-TP; Flags: Precursor [Dictyostelium discoideum]EAL72577.1 hypothetical protein DDB_G0270454 [Dictyostelium discoideum AX4]|eukprot:XP_646816.1 hypothetical protein DDB_G0270454 [Dictyostelium discoideum AX4]
MKHSKNQIVYITFFIIILIVVKPIESVEWNDCSDPNDSFKIEKLEFSPEQPIAGQDLIISISGYLNKEITNGEAYLSITFDRIPIIKLKGNLCNGMGVTCPIQQGNYSTTTINQEIPENAPQGYYYVNFVLYDQDDLQITCIDVQMNITQS